MPITPDIDTLTLAELLASQGAHMENFAGKTPFSLKFDDHRQCDNDYWEAVVSLKDGGLVSYRREEDLVEGFLPEAILKANAALLVAVSRFLGRKKPETISPTRLIERINMTKLAKEHGGGNILSCCSIMPWKLIMKEEYARVVDADGIAISRSMRGRFPEIVSGGRFMVAVSMIFAPLQEEIAKRAQTLARALTPSRLE